MESTKHHVTIAEQTADTILALINSRARSPSKDELVAVLVAHLDKIPNVRASYLESGWHRAVTALDDAARLEDAGTEELDAMDARVHEASHAIWAKPCKTMEDLLVRAAMAIHWNNAGPDELLAEIPRDKRLDEQAMAHLVQGVLDLAGGLEFDNEGRLL
jgi:hypothetical protein